MNFHTLFLTALTVVSFCNLAPASAGQRRVGSWSVEVSKDPITDKPAILAFSDSADLRGAYIRLDCRGDVAAIAIVVTGFKFRPNERAAVVLRIDDLPAIKAEYTTVPDMGMVSAKLSRNTYTAVATAKKIAARVFRESGDSWVMTFPASRTPEALKPMLVACPIASAPEGGPAKYDPSKPILDPATTPAASQAATPPAVQPPAAVAKPVKPSEPAPDAPPLPPK
jgi:hypothetical protein